MLVGPNKEHSILYFCQYVREPRLVKQSVSIRFEVWDTIQILIPCFITSVKDKNFPVLN
jgi:hypothetical protein